MDERVLDLGLVIGGWEMLDDWLFKGFVVFENWDGWCVDGGCWLVLRNILLILVVDVEIGFGLFEGNSCFLRLVL